MRRQRGIVRIWDGTRQTGWIHYARDQKNLHFAAKDLRDITTPVAGQPVGFYRKGSRAVCVRPWRPVAASQAEQGKDDLAAQLSKSELA